MRFQGELLDLDDFMSNWKQPKDRDTALDQVVYSFKRLISLGTGGF